MTVSSPLQIDDDMTHSYTTVVGTAHELQAPLRWCSHKCDIPQATTPEPFLVSHDVNASGAKEFFRFDSLAEALSYLTSHQGGPNNEVLEHHDLACKLYFDLDRPDTTYSID
jgi:phage gp29-like protein